MVAQNRKGEANVAAQVVRGYSGEASPSEAPNNFVLNEVLGPRSAMVSWEPVNPNTINGEFKGYKIQTWTQLDTEKKLREIVFKRDEEADRNRMYR